MGFEYIIRFRQCITVTPVRGERRAAAEWVPASGRALRLKAARVTDDEAPVGAVVLVKKVTVRPVTCRDA
ncbi:hypothetical protein HJC10_31185 [Corallococcus exiguus]|nr:hypothetical protein [Corallococcus exiguus]